jgi:hypothetical protein
MICVYPSGKIEKLCTKNQSSKTVRKTRLFNKRETNFMNQKRKNFEEGMWKRERDKEGVHTSVLIKTKCDP